MSLLNDAMENCTFLTKTIESDGMGGYTTVYTDGISFRAAVTYANGVEARIAQAQGVRNLYTVTTGKEIALEYHDAFRRERDGKIFRVTSDGDDNLTPNTATLNMRQVSAEEWSLPNG